MVVVVCACVCVCGAVIMHLSITCMYAVSLNSVVRDSILVGYGWGERVLCLASVRGGCV